MLVKTIRKDTHTIKISEVNAMKMAAFTSKDASYNKERGELTFVVENATQKAFRLVYEGQKYFALVDGTARTITSTLHIIEEFETEGQALDRIEELSLEPFQGEQPGKGQKFRNK